MATLTPLPDNYADMATRVITFIKDKAPANGVVVGISGGIDSAVVFGLSVRALGADRVKALFMPVAESDVSDVIKKYVSDLGVTSETIPLRPIFEAYREHGNVDDNQVVLGNLKARIRMSLLYSRSNAHGLVAMGTGNRSELLAGYFTKYGDGGVDYLPIGDLYKTQVRGVARHIGVPEPIITQPPTAGLWDGQTDEDELGITYEKLDQILSAYTDNDLSFDQIDAPGITADDIKIVQDRVEKNSFKLTLPAICQIRQ